jgi:hypothetical protein
LEELLKSADGKRLKKEELNLFWDQAAAASASGTASADDISYEGPQDGLTCEDG